MDNFNDYSGLLDPIIYDSPQEKSDSSIAETATESQKLIEPIVFDEPMSAPMIKCNTKLQ